MIINKANISPVYKMFPFFISFVLLVTSIVPAMPVFSAPGAVSAASSIAPGILACVNFGDLAAGQSVEGLGTVHPQLNIASTGNAVAIFEDNATAAAYGAPNLSVNPGPSILNNGVGANGGFSDIDKLHEYSFSFAPNVTVSFFSIKLYDFGDFNPAGATEHGVDLLAFDDANIEIERDTLFFTSGGGINPTTGSAGNLQLTGDAVTALPQQPGNYEFSVSGSNINSLELQFSHNNSNENESSDPNIGLAVVCFQTESEINTNLCVDFVVLEPGSSVEGLGTLHPDLNISTSGNAVAIQQADATAGAYGAPNASAGLGASIINNGIGALGGFADLDRVHDYQFAFSPDYSVDFFSIKMLDYGDFNQAQATEHQVSLVGYDVNDNVVSTSVLEFTSDAGTNPTTGSAGNLQLTGDAVTATEQEPGNFTFSVSGSGITRLALEFANNLNGESGVSDPNFGISVLCFIPETPEIPNIPTDVCLDFASLAPGTSVETEGILHPDLNISSTGNTVAIQEGDATFAGYGAPNASVGVGESIPNNGVGPLGGFVDLDRLHEYEFSFQDGSSVNSFAVKMLDFGDFNQAQATEHAVTLVAYDVDDNVVATTALEFTSDADTNPTTGSAGNLQYSGDAITAFPQEPGNFIFTVDGSGITHLSLEFANNVGEGHQVSDPNLSLAVLCFELEDPEDPEIDPPSAALDLLRPKFGVIGGQFRVTYACSESAPNLVSATLNGLNMVNGQNVVLIVDENDSFRERDGLITFIFGPEFSLDVTCADDAGNEVSTSVVPDFTP